MLRKNVKPVIIGISGTELTEQEKGLLQEHNPLGVALFARNIKKNDKNEQDKGALAHLITSIKEILGENSIIAIDQEGGRVQRLDLKSPSAKFFGDLVKEEGLEIVTEQCKQNYSYIGKELKSLGINLDFAPVADLSYAETHKVIGDRSFSSKPEIVVPLCSAAIEGLQQERVQACIKHIPGHGRAIVDSHKELPRVKANIQELEKTDFKVFKELSAFGKAKLAMTAHIVYEAIDPDKPATLSAKVINYVREKIGFKSLIITDAIEMKALSGSKTDIAKQALEVGVDIVLLCTGNFEDSANVLGALSEVSIVKYNDLIL